jgi:cobalamin synthase
MIGTTRWDEVIALGIVIGCVGLLIYPRPVKTPEVVLGTIVVAVLFATYWIARIRASLGGRRGNRRPAIPRSQSQSAKRRNSKAV